MELRWLIKKDGTRVLQNQTLKVIKRENDFDVLSGCEWRDIPIVEEGE